MKKAKLSLKKKGKEERRKIDNIGDIVLESQLVKLLI